MAATAMRTMLGVVIDAGASMGSALREVKTEAGSHGDGGDETTKIALATAVINYHVVQRQLASKTVEFSVATFGNYGAIGGDDNDDSGSASGFKLICRMGKLDPADMNRVDKVALGSSPSTDKDFIDGMNGMSDILTRTNQGKKYNRLMLLMTDSNFMVSSIGKLDALMNNCRDNGLILHMAVIGDRQTIAASKVVSENLKLFESMVSVTGGSVGVISSIGDSIAFFANIAGMNTKSTNYKTTFSLSATVNIPCVYWGRVMKNTLPSLKKQSSTNGDVKTIISYRNPDDPDEEIAFDQKVKGYRYGSEYIPMTGLDESSLKLKSNAVVRLLGFLSKDKVPRYHYMDSTQILESEPENSAALTAFTALCDALRNTQSVALVRLVKRTDADPALAALVPFAPELFDSRSRLMIHRLPCAEDIRDMPFPSLYDARFGKGNTKSQNESMGAFVDAMTISPSELVGGTITTFNPSFPWLSREIVGNLIDNKNSKTLSVPIGNPLSMPPQLVEQNSSFAKRLRSEFETTVVDKSKKKKKIYWNELDVSTPEGGSAAGVQAETKPAASEDAMVTLTASSTHPVDDFKRDIATGSRLVQQVSFANMTNIITDLVIEGGTNAHYRKAIACLKALREAAVETLNVSAFNQFISSDIKAVFSHGGRHKKFWEELVSDGSIKPISSDEVPSSPVSPSEADAFFHKPVEQAAAPVVAVAAAADDDMFDDLE